jgi:hypothetical protein
MTDQIILSVATTQLAASRNAFVRYVWYFWSPLQMSLFLETALDPTVSINGFLEFARSRATSKNQLIETVGSISVSKNKCSIVNFEFSNDLE